MTMRAAHLHGIGDLRVEELPVPEPGPGELLVRVEACGVCPTDVRKFLIGVNDGEYPFNPGHEWVGWAERAGPEVSGLDVGQRVYGDTYSGYAEYAIVTVEPAGWSRGALPLPDDLPLERAIFVEPLADCLHAIRDQGRVREADRVAVVGAGQMGAQLVVAARAAGAEVVAVDPLEERRELARFFGATVTAEDVRELEGGADVVVLSVGLAELVAPALALARPGGRVVLFAGFGERFEASLDLNRIHYEEISVVGSEWIGAPPGQRWERYDEALELLCSGEVPLERLVTARCGLDGLAGAFADVQARRGLKTMLVPSLPAQ